MISSFKSVEKIFKPKESSEGEGAKVYRIIGSTECNRLDPFLMLDYFATKLPGGFPDHPHRGFETVTYMISGSFIHEDFKGNKGIIGPGDVQWMTAGKGIVHAEMPASWEEESIGFQLWINLRRNKKMCDPKYQEIKKDKIPVVTKDNVTVKVIAGESLEVKGPIATKSPVLYLDVEMGPNSTFEQAIPKGWSSIAHVFKGEAYFGSEKQKVGLDSTVLFKKEDDGNIFVETLDKGGRFVFIAGQPFNEPIVSAGPFVLSNKSDLEKTFNDYQRGENGFENAPGWKSKIRDLSKGKSKGNKHKNIFDD